MEENGRVKVQKGRKYVGRKGERVEEMIEVDSFIGSCWGEEVLEKTGKEVIGKYSGTSPSPKQGRRHCNARARGVQGCAGGKERR